MITWKFLRRVVVGMLLLGAAIGLLCCAAVLSHRSQIVSVDNVAPAPIAIIFGARVKNDGTPSDILRDRLLTGIDLYDRRIVTKLLLTGDDGQIAYDEVNAMRVFVLDHGVAPSDVFLDHAGFDTFDSVVRASKVFGVTQAILVTQRYHLPRALYLAEAFGITAQGVSADRQTYRGMLRYEMRELLADIKAVFDVVFHTSPKYLGEPIDATGDGRATWDEGF